MEEEVDTSITRNGRNTTGPGAVAEITKELAYNSNGDPFFLHSSNHHGMMLVTTLLIGNNYLTWSRSMKIALGAKLKLGFVDGRIAQPNEGTTEFELWTRVNYMVTSWILNSISKEIVDAFLYTTTAKELWDEIAERFGESNGLLLYQIQRDISSISQGNESVAKYYTRLKRLWDELTCLMPIPPCTCGSAKAVVDLHSFNRLMQFLMGLNDCYDNIMSQILVMKSLPSVNRAYSLVLRVKKQREVHIAFNENIDSTELFAKTQNTNQPYRRGGTNKGNTKKIDMGRKDRDSKYCDHCNVKGHVKETCFKLHGYPEWYKDLKEQ
ncbi:PREDICTED: uncharacterized protein LOC109113939 [Nelumbo nucifera]|uniref:Uncharacterized protein LOC109113939 n=1 Tax=Nelumbo nucifera TaxID=4432 RepID=A0A1U8Q0A3_NELNU|nr:PREDICTED: uncharacterized protein LOC109113939 [Nelumbo nucifera]